MWEATAVEVTVVTMTKTRPETQAGLGLVALTARYGQAGIALVALTAKYVKERRVIRYSEEMALHRPTMASWIA